MNKKAHLVGFILGGLLLFFDQLIKYYFYHHQNFSSYLIKPWLGLEYFENTGIAFGIPVPQPLVIFYTPFVLLVLFLFVFKKEFHTRNTLIATYTLIAGAISNFIDRIFFDFTIDYIRVITSILNIADLMIVGGALILIWKWRKR